MEKSLDGCLVFMFLTLSCHIMYLFTQLTPSACFFVIFINNDAMGILEGFPHPFKETSFHHGPDGDDDYFSPEVALST